MSDKVEFWFNTKTKSVESGPQSLSLYRLGPFDSFDEAQRGTEIIAQRAREIREQDQERDQEGWKD